MLRQLVSLCIALPIAAGCGAQLDADGADDGPTSHVELTSNTVANPIHQVELKPTFAPFKLKTSKSLRPKTVLASLSPPRDHQRTSRKPSHVPKFGLMANDDGDNLFRAATPKTSIDLLRKHMRRLGKTGVDTLALNVSAGVLYFQTRTGSRYGWRNNSNDQPAKNSIWERIAWAQNLFDAKIDPVLEAIKAFKLSGRNKRVFLSYRISDDHFVNAPLQHPLTTKFWMDNRHLIIGKERAPVKGYPTSGNLLDFTHKKVRQHTENKIFEVINTYAKDIDGIELDFMRTPYLFPRNTGYARRHLITDLMEHIRKKLNAASKKTGKQLYLSVRTPPSISNSLWAGLDIETWINSRLIDVVIPSQLMTIAHDLPVKEFVDLARPHGVKVYPAILGRRNMGWRFLPTPKNLYINRLALNAHPYMEYAFGAALNYYEQGADGIQIYNFSPPTYTASKWFPTFMAGLKKPQLPLQNEAIVFAVPPSMHFDAENTYEYAKSLPAIINANNAHAFQMKLAKSAAKKAVFKNVYLRIGFHRTNYRAATKLIVKLNRKLVYSGQISDANFIATNIVKPTSPSQEFNRRSLVYSIAPGSYIHIPVPASALKPGQNKIAVKMTESTSILDITLAMFPLKSAVYFAPNDRNLQKQASLN